MVTPRRRPPPSLDALEDEARLAAMREKGAQLSVPLRLLAFVGALAFVMLGLAGILMPLRLQSPPPPEPTRSAAPEA